MYYTFIQNNSGGYFDSNSDVCEYVIIEANNAKHANDRATEIGLYFDGAGDCPCCGNRWDEQWDDAEGTETPLIYRESVYELFKGIFRAKCIIHRLDGSKEAVEFK
ncbi:hypothetical protein BBD42_15420 [Paenibacillus sp. BIHB 4019]|uniref:DUF7296 domain-containing protein n=1 Tax=Paenibacillus sp. BIHB 4019 TaxID=1870819 RepID=A0A1B2DIY5_9BACL|nr:hypothetical protein [Paenibacillus sp. BIHB 4019]ANY67700.1 hypothetical protein BBD42_15420 [Paenibacillus sp. BIHB 4019]